MDRFLYGSPGYVAYMREHGHERGEKEFLESIAKDGMIAVDVGGHFGFTACAISRAIGPTGRLYCFEPVREHCRVAEDNILENRLTNVELMCTAVGDKPGTTWLYRDGAATSIARREGRQALSVRVVSLDGFFEERGLARLDLLNMDCEGSELLVLQGARGLLRSNPVKVFVEVHHEFLQSLGHSARDIIGFLEHLGYEVSSVSLSDLALGHDWEGCEYLYARR